ncbi:MAG: flagellar motor switch protein FliM [Symbiobacterium sp.]|uniref:flagellar motor switch protein FliM n=1 Tax=Symbiobacterium sp. TaxID=1971213 RepID=UPI003464774F
MESLLSQAEIDALIMASETNIRTYDFRRPSKFNKDLIRTLVLVHENLARLLQSYLSAGLRTWVQINVRATNQFTYSEFTQLMPNPTVALSFKLNPLPGICLLEISPNVAFAIVERVFGGPGSDEQPQRELTEIELGIIQRVVRDTFGPMKEAWRNVADLDPSIEAVDTNPVFIQTGGPTEAVAAITLAVEIGEHLGHMTYAYPYSTVEPVLSRLSPQSWLADAKLRSPSEEESLRRAVQEAPLSLTAQLGTARIRLGEFLALEVGDIIRLDTRVGAELPVFVGTKLAFHGRPGVVGSRMAVQITRRAF